MTAWRHVFELAIEDEDLARLMSIARSRTEAASRVERARMLLSYRDDPSFFAVGRALTHATTSGDEGLSRGRMPIAQTERSAEFS